ncbi:MAG: cobalamin-dependent protein [Magnetococcales bacterium]|nr:cobalamin-dependent protein [Magnetococcales bacterium]
MRVLLVIAQQASMTTYQLPVGIGYIAASLKCAGHDVKTLNPNHSLSSLEAQLAQVINAFKPQMLGVGGMSFHMQQILQTVVMARPMLPPDAVIVIGGTIISNHPDVTMRAIPGADIGVVGEGEKTIVELVEALESQTALGQINGLIYRDHDNKLVQTPPRPIETNLDSLPWIDWEEIGLDTFASLHRPGELAPGLIVKPGARVMPFLSSRGCPFSCTFCCHAIAGRRYRTRSMDDIFAELKYAIDKFGIDTIAFYDDIFCLKPKTLKEFCARIRPLKLRWQCSLRVEQVNVENLKLMKDSGCVCISFGVESMSPVVLESMKKSTTRDDLVKALAIMYDARITTWANLIFGDPAETMETALESLEWWAENNHLDLRTAFIGYHPGSTIYEDALAKGVIKDPLDFLLLNKPEINATAMSDEEYNLLKNFIIPHHVLAFGMPGKILGLEHADKPEFFRLKSVCPHCKEVQIFNDIVLSPFIVNRLSCIKCNQMQRLPIRFRKQAIAEVKQLTDKLNAILQTNNNIVPTPMISEVFDLCAKLTKLDNGHDLAWWIFISILIRRNMDQDAIFNLKMAINANPYNLNLFDKLVTLLEKSGQEKEGAKYARQANLLRSLDVTRVTEIYYIEDG